MNINKNNYMYNFNEEEKRSIESWSLITGLLRKVQQDCTDNAILENKEYVINSLVNFISKLTDFHKQFETTNQENYLDNLRIALTKLMCDVEKKIDEKEAPNFFKDVSYIFEKVTLLEEDIEYESELK